jgi:hypothetical protein
MILALEQLNDLPERVEVAFLDHWYHAAHSRSSGAFRRTGGLSEGRRMTSSLTLASESVGSELPLEVHRHSPIGIRGAARRRAFQTPAKWLLWSV